MRVRLKFILGAAIGSVITALFLHPPMSSQDWAAWIQAAGSVAAIVGAYSMGKSQSLEQRKMAFELVDAAARRRWTTVKAAIDEIYQQCLNMENYFQHEEKPFGNIAFWTYSKDSYDAAITLCAAIPIFELENEPLAKSVVRLVSEARNLQSWIELAQKIVKEQKEIEGLPSWGVKEMGTLSIGRIRTLYEVITGVTGGEPITAAQAIGEH